MKFDFSEATASVEGMIAGFIERLPYIVVAIIVFILFDFLAISARKLIHSFSHQDRRHYKLSLVRFRPAGTGVTLYRVRAGDFYRQFRVLPACVAV